MQDWKLFRTPWYHDGIAESVGAPREISLLLGIDTVLYDLSSRRAIVRLPLEPPYSTVYRTDV